MAATYPLTIERWKSLLERINALARNPPEGCNAVAELQLVAAPHKWRETDIAAARSKLSEICSNNVFSAPSTGKWRKAIIDELEIAIDSGWCNCERTPCCIPNGQGTVRIEGPGGGYDVTIPYSQVIEQFLYANISYESADAAIPAGVMARLVECVAGSQLFIPHSLHHDHWVNCLYQSRWVDDGSNRNDEYWQTCETDPTETTYLGAVPALAPSYHGSTSVGSHNYYDQPMLTQYLYDYYYQRWYGVWWIGYFEVDSYSYYFLMSGHPPMCS